MQRHFHRVNKNEKEKKLAVPETVSAWLEI